MKKWIPIAGAGALVLAAVVTWQLWPAPKASSGEKAEGAARHAAPSRRPRADFEAQQKVAENLDSLLAENTPEAWQKIMALYPDAGHEAKRKVFQRIAKIDTLDTTLQYLLQTVGNDPTPALEDPMVDEAAALLKNRFRAPDDLERGRQTLLLQETDKRRWVVASSMIEAVKGLPTNSPLNAQKTKLMAKLVDMHSRTTDEAIRGKIVDELSALGGGDAALILAKGGKNVDDDELAGLTTKRAVRDDVLKGVDAK